MLLPFWLAAVVLLAHESLCKTNEVLSMKMHTSTKEKAKWAANPTWHSETLGIFLKVPVPAGQDISDRGLIDIANMHYNWLVQQPNSRTRKGACLVASEWDPRTKTVYSSTIPQGLQKALMYKQTQKKDPAAPSWKEAMKVQLTKDQYGKVPRKFHAEDGVFYNREVVQGLQSFNGRHPPGSKIAVWGKLKNDATDRQISLCSGQGNNARTPSCRNVAQVLGVAPVPITYTPTPQQQQADNNEDDLHDDNSDDEFAQDVQEIEDEFSGGLTDAELLQAYADVCEPSSSTKRSILRSYGLARKAGIPELTRRSNSTCEFPNVYANTGTASISLSPSAYVKATGSSMAQPTAA